METVELKNYAFTLQIPSFKKVKHQLKYVKYGDLKSIEQEEYLYGLVRSNDDIIKHFEIKFELHQDGRTHAHGTIYQITEAQLNEFRQSVCFQIGIKSPKQMIDCCYCIPILFSYGWNLYCNKEQTDETIIDLTDKYSKYLFKGKKN